MLGRRKFIRIISYLVALCIVFAASGMFTARAKSEYESTLERVRLEGLNSLTEYSREIASGLRLLAVSADESMADSSAYVCARAVGAMGSLGCFNSEKADNIIRFFGGAYDFAEKFSGSEESRRAAVRLSDYAQEMYYHLSDLTNAVLSGKYSLSEYDSIYRKPRKPYFENELDFFNGTEDELFAVFSSAATQGNKYRFLDGKERISVDEAKQKASEITGINSALWRDGEENGDVDIYAFVCGNTEVDICREGGVVCGIVNPQPTGKAVYSVDDARKKAAEFLENNGFENMVEIQHRQGMFTACFVFAPEINGVIFLTAKTEIDVCLSGGKITYFNAEEYIKNHRTDIRLSGVMPDISRVLPRNLSAEKFFVCFADIDGRERQCVLAVCRYEKDTVYIFIDYYSLKIIKTLTD